MLSIESLSFRIPALDRECSHCLSLSSADSLFGDESFRDISDSQFLEFCIIPPRAEELDWISSIFCLNGLLLFLIGGDWWTTCSFASEDALDALEAQIAPDVLETSCYEAIIDFDALDWLYEVWVLSCSSAYCSVIWSGSLSLSLSGSEETFSENSSSSSSIAKSLMI